MSTSTQSNSEQWHLDKRVPIAIILALVVHLAASFVYIGSLAQRTENNTSRIAALEQQRISERLASVEAQVADSKNLLIRLDQKIDRVIERGSRP
jgi:uncharacterized protein HemX